MKLIYVAGPYRGKDAHAVLHNIAAARKVALKLAARGALQNPPLFPVTPHLNTESFELFLPTIDDSFWLEGTMAILQRCDAVLLVSPEAPSVSAGTKAEVEWALAHGKPVYRTLEALLDDNARGAL